MKFNQLERAAVVGCTAVFLLATADGLGMTWVCPVSGPGSCSEQTSTDERTIPATTGIPASQRSSDDFAGLLGLCPWDERSPDEKVSASLGRRSQEGIPFPVANR